MPEMTPRGAAEMLEDIAAVSDLKAVDGKRSGLVKIGRIDAEDLRIAASCLRKIASGGYAPVIHGRWIHKGCNGIPTENHETVAYAECSNCGHTVHNVDQEADRCPSCGALMDGKDENYEPDAPRR